MKKMISTTWHSVIVTRYSHQWLLSLMVEVKHQRQRLNLAMNWFLRYGNIEIFNSTRYIRFICEFYMLQSNLTTPEDIDNPLNAFPSITSSSSTSHRMSVSRMSASTMSMIAATLKSNSQVT